LPAGGFSIKILLNLNNYTFAWKPFMKIGHKMISMKNIFRISGIIMIIILHLSCKNKDMALFSPAVTTTPVTEILYTTATSGGTITDDGGASVFSRGVCWGTTSNPTIENNRTTDGTGTGQFASSVTGLSLGTSYYLRAYATNSVVTVYGSEISFTTKTAGVMFNPSLTYGTVIDVEGKSYKTVPIGIQVWMAENLKTAKFNDGTAIPLIIDDANWTNLLSPVYCWFDNNDTLYQNIYGAYYNWFAVSTGKLCPVGWHIPTDSEWQLLVDYLGGSNIAGSKIKEAGSNNWIGSNNDATNSSGFTALPGGLRGSYDGTFETQGIMGGWWSSTELETSPLSAAWCRWIHADTTVIARSDIFKKDGFNVRCIKN
jgi:uncharacterized protein (TIGR02145 family)